MAPSAERRAQEDHPDAQVDERDQTGRFERQGAHDPGRGAQEADLRQARRGCARSGRGRRAAAEARDARAAAARGRSARRGRALCARRKKSWHGAAPRQREEQERVPSARPPRRGLARRLAQVPRPRRRQIAAGSEGRSAGQGAKAKGAESDAAAEGEAGRRGRLRRPPAEAMPSRRCASSRSVTVESEEKKRVPRSSPSAARPPKTRPPPSAT